jgi:mannose-6-phosphate isomerase-like protein (cupin superfamily)
LLTLPRDMSRQLDEARPRSATSVMRGSTRSTYQAMGTVSSAEPAVRQRRRWPRRTATGNPLHVHHDEEEAFYILEGRAQVDCGNEVLAAGPGGLVMLPRVSCTGTRWTVRGRVARSS